MWETKESFRKVRKSNKERKLRGRHYKEYNYRMNFLPVKLSRNYLLNPQLLLKSSQIIQVVLEVVVTNLE